MDKSRRHHTWIGRRGVTRIGTTTRERGNHVRSGDLGRGNGRHRHDTR